MALARSRLAYLVVFGSLLAFSAYAWLLRNAQVSLVATYAYVNPVVAVLARRRLARRGGRRPRTLVAGAVILGAVALIVSARPAPAAAAARPTPASSAANRGSIACGSGDSR